MPYSESQKRATIKWMSANYDKISFSAPKGFKERLKSYAESKGVPIRKLIIDILEKEMNK